MTERGSMNTKLDQAEEATIRRFAAAVRERGSRRVSPVLRGEVRGILLRAHLVEAAASRQAGRLVEAMAHMAWVNRLGAELGGGGGTRAPPRRVMPLGLCRGRRSGVLGGSDGSAVRVC